MKSKMTSRVLPVTDGRVLLEDSLRPVLVFLRCNGLVYDFLTPNREHRALYIARCIFTGLIMLIVSSHTVFELHQIVVVYLYEDGNVMFMILAFKMAFNGSLGVLTAFIFCIHGKQFQQFFDGWKQVEMQSSECCKGNNPNRKTRGLNILKGFALLVIIMQPCSIIYIYSIRSNEPYLLSYYSFFRERFNTYFIGFFHASAGYYCNLFWFLGDVLSICFFYHAGCVIEDLVSEVQHTTELYFSKSVTFTESGSSIVSAINCDGNDRFRQGRPFRRIWQRYETVVGWVNRGNQLFGALILWSQLISFISVIVSIYLSFKSFSLPPMYGLISAAMSMRTCFRLVLANQLVSHLYLSRGNLQSAIDSFLSDNWYRLPDEDRHFLVSFQARLHREDLAACPLNLFTVNPTNLLTMLSLIVTYMVVIFQTDAVV